MGTQSEYVRYGVRRISDTVERNTRGKACPSATLSVTNLAQGAPGSKTGPRSKKSETNHLSYSAARRFD